MSEIIYGNIKKVISEINTDITNNIGKHNDFVVITNSEERFPNKVDPVILRYDQNIGEWVLVADKTVIDFGYLKELIEIKDNDVFLHKSPLDRVIWDVFILDENKHIIKIIDPKDFFLNNNYLLGLNPYKGQTLSLMYAYGEREENGEIIRVDNPTVGTYYNQELDILTYDGPYDMNDILVDIVYPDGNSYFDSVILKRIKELDAAVELLNSRKLYTTNKLLIKNNSIKLPYKPIGSVVHDIALIYFSNDSNDIIMEVTCSVVGNYLIFDELDGLNDHYAVVTYLAELLSPVV
jgi:hypothetical protein